jgi:SAM-dependent methyltransferase
MYLLIPGRHHLLTNFQFRYLFRFSQQGLAPGKPLHVVIFAVTSANHSGTRRNPLPLIARALQIQLFGQNLDIPVLVYGIPDVGERPDFADFVVKSIEHESLGLHNLTPANTVVAGSTGVMDLYRKSGFEIFEAEAETDEPLPWEFVVRIAEVGLNDRFVLDGVHPASLKIWRQYRWDDKVKSIFDDPLVGGDGDLTETRDYGTYVRQMDENVDLKFQDVSPFLLPGRIGDIGCAVGSWIKKATLTPQLRDSDFYGIELARPLFEICRQRKENGEFGTPNVFFSQKNAVTGLCFHEQSMDVIHTGSLTHEIASYGHPEALGQFLANRRKELKPGGIWINRDVVGCERPNELVQMELFGSTRGEVVTWSRQDSGQKELDRQSPWTRFLQFVQDFRPGTSRISYEILSQSEESTLLSLRRSDAQEFLLHKDYTDNWQSEMKETFTFWNYLDWKRHLEDAGFVVDPRSRTYTNLWIRDQRWLPSVRLWVDRNIQQDDWFPTTMVMVAIKN